MANKFVAIKLKGVNYWLWFDTLNVETDTSSEFIAKDGWGKNGEVILTLNIEKKLIEGRLSSNSLGY